MAPINQSSEVPHVTNTTSLPQVIWEQGRVAAVSQTGRAVASMRSRNAWASVAWRSFMNMAKLNWLS